MPWLYPTDGWHHSGPEISQYIIDNLNYYFGPEGKIIVISGDLPERIRRRSIWTIIIKRSEYAEDAPRYGGKVLLDHEKRKIGEICPDKQTFFLFHTGLYRTRIDLHLFQIFELSNLAQIMGKRKRTYSKKKIKEVLDSQRKTREEELEAEISYTAGKAEAALRDYINVLRRLEALKKVKAEGDSLFNPEAQVKELKKIKNIIPIITDSSILIYVKQYFLRGRYKGGPILTFKMPPVYMVIDWNFRLKIFSENGEPAHPHVGYNGNPCWGNIGRFAADMAAKRNLVGLVKLMLEFLQSWNPYDQYEHPENIGGEKIEEEELL